MDLWRPLALAALNLATLPVMVGFMAAPYLLPWFHPTQRRKRQARRAEQRALRGNRTREQWQQQVRAHAVAQWQAQNWWRMEPPEGWQIGFNCSHVPPAAHAHVQRHGRIVPPTYAEIYRAMGVA